MTIGKAAMDAALSRIAHHTGKGQKWIDREREEWERSDLLMESDEAALEKAVSSLVAGKDRYYLDGLLARLGRRREIKPAGDGCQICTSGMVELAIWRGDEVTAFNPEIKAIRCKCNKGGLVKDACYALKESDRGITEIYMSVESFEGRPIRRRLNREETGEVARLRLRKAGVPLPGSMPAIYPDQFTVAPVVVRKQASSAVNRPDIRAAMEQLSRRP